MLQLLMLRRSEALRYSIVRFRIPTPNGSWMFQFDEEIFTTSIFDRFALLATSHDADDEEEEE